MDKTACKGGKQAEYGYTIRDWVESINDINNPQGSFAGFYEYQKNGNISMSRFYNPDVHQDLSDHKDYRYVFDYDALNRLTGAEYRYGASTNGTATNRFDVGGLNYDANGNILSLQRCDDSGTLVDNLTYSYGSNNRLSSVNDAAGQIHNWDAFSSSFDYDANGNMISQSGKFTNIAYEHRNLPVHFYLDNDTELIANYNAEGQRILKESSGGAWSFYVTDGMQTLAVIEDDTLRHMNLVGNDLFGRIEASSGTISTGNTRRYYLKDHLGSTRVVVGNDGIVKETHDFYPFGLTMPGRSKGEALTREQFTGQLRDNEAGFNLDYFGARYYDAAVPRFISVDPLADEYPRWSPYVYALNNPLRYNDPTGMCPEEDDIDCVDDTSYREGAIVENRFGSWEYQGDGQWQTLSLTAGTAANAGVFGTIASGGIRFFDAVADAGAQMTLLTGGLTAASLKTPTLFDTRTLAGLTILSAGITMSADAAATGLAGVDAIVFGGDVYEFRARINATLLSAGISVGSGYLYRSQLRRLFLDMETQRALERAATTTTSKTVTQPFRNR